MIELTPELAQQLASVLSSASGDANDQESAALLQSLADAVTDAMDRKSAREAETARNREFLAHSVRRTARRVVTNNEEVNTLLAGKLAEGLGLTVSQLASLLRSQADLKIYQLMADEADDTQLLRMLEVAVRECRRLLASGTKHTDSIDRAVQEYDRDAAAAFLNQWADLA
jgi:hypothetical protein